MRTWIAVGIRQHQARKAGAAFVRLQREREALRSELALVFADIREIFVNGLRLVISAGLKVRRLRSQEDGSSSSIRPVPRFARISGMPARKSSSKKSTASKKAGAKKTTSQKTSSAKKRTTASKTSKRTLIEPNKDDRRFVRRSKTGEFTTQQVDVGRSLAADSRSKSKTKVPKGQGDRGETSR